MAVMVMMIRRRWWRRPILWKWRGLCHDANTQQQCCGEEKYPFHIRLDAIDSPRMQINFRVAQSTGVALSLYFTDCAALH
jgi:hypothetical protein